ncbi:MAG: hypothetical protein A2725_01560 [Candidatus Magasanikbacteria bacterium RIFCSPHIGHO2_01_FULL_33_34]|uniref:Uncharacterized protein n=1 Tax=Candidatus Magasanikbacteria bacterium RIFCSPHIGHO2_01_FULL_33_34 TaxID=1798671 RepID=A0A1F6LJC5_9BACT|nr:MAG: hypothetical protein A2725_01560 [Candidatus Magasanikbacteria bacterium RIFCSPHIGHO2_01_FULL_33_34]OGH65500.1 MAG: hypothetical protein A3B83_01315 [Candidatus Magasanikbacteria bacterium RIFCSPHIGHO2_02_FULL_33_17]OGH76210.1 MAG: hypothetical protein A3A89_02135 [Candidatus Magasanikbacteria bacterium RIFCSPLOWO2_01_FULL_33_34]
MTVTKNSWDCRPNIAVKAPTNDVVMIEGIVTKKASLKNKLKLSLYRLALFLTKSWAEISI